MNSKNLRKRLEKLGYRLEKDIFGWIVVSQFLGFEWRFSTLGGVGRFVIDEESLSELTTR